MENKNMLKHALAYLEKGISVFPLIENGKSPLSEALPMYDNGTETKSSWIPFQRMHPTKDQVIEWWTKYPNANIAGVMGKISGVICADQDVLKDENKKPILDEFNNHKKRGDISGFPVTLSATTWSGGKHMIYKYIDGVITKHGFREMVDIQSDRSYIVLAPSIVNGKPYEWDIEWEEMWDILPLFPIEVIPKDKSFSERLNIKDLIGVKAGSRNDSMHKLACSFYAKGYTDEETTFMIGEINRTYNPHIELNELVNILQSARSFISRTRSEEKVKVTEAFNLISWKDFDAIKFPENPWRIDKLIPEYGITVLAAPSGGRKSWVAIEMIRSIASGLPFIGKFSTKQGNVLYIEQETPQEEIQRRGRQLRLNEAEGIFIASSKEAPLNLNSDSSMKQLMEYSESKNISTIFIDTLRSVAGGLKEEKAEEVRLFFNRFKPLTERGVAIIILDHTRKPRQFETRGKPMIDQILGSQDKIASATNVLMLGPSTESNTITFHQMKLKGGKEERPFVIKMRDENEGVTGHKTYLEHGGDFEEEDLKIEQAKEFIIEYLEAEGVERKTREIIEALNGKVGKSNVESALKYMREAKKIGFRKNGNSFYHWLPIEANTDVFEQAVTELNMPS